jgi:adenine-specific DNA methylase
MSKPDIKDFQVRLRKGIELSNLTKEELEYVQKPIGAGIYQAGKLIQTIYTNPHEIKSNSEDLSGQKCKSVEKESIKNLDSIPEKKWNDKLTCRICGQVITRSNQSTHRKSYRHRLHEALNEKMMSLLITKR